MRYGIAIWKYIESRTEKKKLNSFNNLNHLIFPVVWNSQMKKSRGNCACVYTFAYVSAPILQLQRTQSKHFIQKNICFWRPLMLICMLICRLRPQSVNIKWDVALQSEWGPKGQDLLNHTTSLLRYIPRFVPVCLVASSSTHCRKKTFQIGFSNHNHGENLTKI